MAKATEIGGRYLCSILDDMRTCQKTQNYSYLLSLIEEAQYRANRMEDRLNRYCDGYSGLEGMEERYVKLKVEVKELEKKKNETT